ncbi:TPA: tail fiber assembly protein [Citrobacter werkmanii]
MKYGRIEENIVVEIIDFDPAGKFNDALVWMTVPDDCETGWVHKNGNIKPPEISQATLIENFNEKKQSLLAEATQKTQLWQTQLMLDIITDEDKSNLKEWMLYVQQVDAVNLYPGVDVIWPSPPGSPVS